MSTKRNKIKNRPKKSKKSLIWIVVLVLMFAAIGTLVATSIDKDDISKKVGNGLVKYEKVKAKNGIIKLAVKDFSDNKASYYTYTFPQGDINFFVLQSSDGIIRAAFDSCDVCYRAKKGYRQEGDLMVCNNCGQKFPSVRINEEKGGCNPAPLNRKVVDGFVEIKLDDIYGGMKYFSSGL